jgi:hypothetical protein
MNPWWLGLAPAQASVICGGAEHRLRWEAGELTALDHEDPEAERALAALGAERCACVDVLDAWAAHRDDARVLVLASRGQIDPLAPPGDETPQFGAAQPAILGGLTLQGRGRRTRRPRRRAAASAAFQAGGGGGFFGSGAGPTDPMARKAQAENELIALLGLRGALPERLAATVAAAWRERLEQRDRGVARVRPQLQAALHGRACAAIRPWLGETDRHVSLTMIGDDEEPSLAAGDSGVRAELPFALLVDVWCKGLVTIWGRFCLSATTDDGQVWELVTIGPDFGRAALVRVELSDRPADRG